MVVHYNKTLFMKSLSLVKLVVLALIFCVSPSCLLAQKVIFYETFDNMNGTGGNDDKWSDFTLSEIPSDIPAGWTFADAKDYNKTNVVFAASKCICIGVGSNTNVGNVRQNPYVDTPEIEIVGDYVLTFRAGAWKTETDNASIVLMPSTKSGHSAITFDGEGKKTIKLSKGEFKSYSVNVKVINANAKICFQCENKTKNRFFLDDVKLVSKGGDAPNPGEDTKKTPSLSFSLASCTAVWNGTNKVITTPTLTTELSASDIIYSSSNTQVAKVDDAGAVTICGGGMSVISANFEGNETYNSASASYTLTVRDASQNTYFQRATTFELDKEYIIAAECENNIYVAKFNGTDTKDSGLPSDVVTKEDDKLMFTPSQDYSPYVIKFIANGNTMAMYCPVLNKYVLASNLSTNFKYENKVNSGLWNTEANPFDDNGYFILKYDARYLNFSDKKDFRAYTTLNYGKQIYLYEKVEKYPLGTIEVKAPERYGTFFTDKSFIMPKGIKGATIPSYDETTGKLQYNWAYTAGTTVPANTALVIYADKVGAYPYYEASATNRSDAVDGLEQPNDVVSSGDVENNYLHGTLTDALTAEDQNQYKFYQLTYGLVNGVKTIGFFFNDENGGPFTNKANRAYLAMPKNFNLTECFALSANITATQINGVENQVQKNSSKIYTLDGRVVKKTTLQQLQPGFYIINGRKQIIK